MAIGSVQPANIHDPSSIKAYGLKLDADKLVHPLKIHEPSLTLASEL